MAEARQHNVDARRIWADKDADASGAPSPDGKLLSYTDWAALSLGIRNLETGENRYLARGTDRSGFGGFPEGSAFSNDGKRLAYRWVDAKGTDLRVVDVAGSEPRVIVPKSPSITSIYPREWTKDDREILVSVIRPDRTIELAFADVASGSLRTIKTFNWDDVGSGSAALSRDGQYLAISMRSGKLPAAESDIVIVTRDASREVSRLPNAGFESVVGWTADGRLVYQWSRKATSDGSATTLYSVQMRDGRPVGGPQVLKTDMSRAIYPRVTPDGRLFYGLFSGSYDVYVAGLDVANARVLAPPTRTTHRLIGFNQGIDWTADGRSAVYLVREGPAPRSAAIIAIRDQESGDVRELRPNLDYINAAIRWSTDGRSILVQATDNKGRLGVFTIDASSGKPTPIVFADAKGGVIHRPQWAPDGRSIYYAIYDTPSPDYRIVHRELATGQEHQIFTAPKLGPTFALSDDGSALAVAQILDGSTVVSVLSASGGLPRELLRVPAPDRVNSLTWSRDGKYVLYTRQSSAEMAGELWRVSVTGGTPTPIGLGMKNMTGLRVHPDGRRVGFTGGEGQMEVWTMDTKTAGTARTVGSAR